MRCVLWAAFVSTFLYKTSLGWALLRSLRRYGDGLVRTDDRAYLMRDLAMLRFKSFTRTDSHQSVLQLRSLKTTFYMYSNVLWAEQPMITLGVGASGKRDGGTRKEKLI